jgi:type I restriction enzyme S subunit
MQLTPRSTSSVQAGYKQTEVGIIPEDWECKEILNCASEIFLGLTTKVDYVLTNGIPLVRATDIASGKLDFTEAREISVEQHKKLTKYRNVKKGDVLVSKSGSLGVCAIVDTNTVFSIYESIIAIQPQKTLDAKYLLNLLRSEDAQERMKGGKVGSGVSHLNLIGFRQLAIQLPPTKTEQEAIAGALSDADAWIESLEQLIAKKRRIKEGASQALLTGKQRLPGFTGDWEVKTIRSTLSALMDYRGRTPKKLGMDWGGGNIRALSAGNVRMGYIDFSNECYFGSEELYKKWMVHGDTIKDDILMTTEAPLGNAALIPDNQKYILSQRTILLRPDKQLLDNHFLYHTLTSSAFQDLLKLDSSGSTATGIQRLKFEKIPIRLPSIPEQTAIAEILSEMDAELDALAGNLSKARQIKQGMMQELLTGKTRLV